MKGKAAITGQRAIGVFDSGVGGLSVLRHIHQRLPHEPLLYIADSQYMPYGCKPAAAVQARCMALASFLDKRRCKAIVVACNTATAAAVGQLREQYPLPVIGMEPAVKPAVQQSTSRVVGVLTTSGTAASEKFNRLASRFSQQARLIVQSCPGLVERIEAGDMAGEQTRGLLLSFLQPLMQQGMDTLVLGCTHYPFVTQLIREIIGDEIAIIDSGDAIARELECQLQRRHVLSEHQLPACIEFWSSGDTQTVTPIIARLWGEQIVLNKLSLIPNPA